MDPLSDSRTPISDAVKRSINEAFSAVPNGKRGALLVIADEHGARAMLAARLGSSWKVAASGEKPWNGQVIGTVSVQGSW